MSEYQEITMHIPSKWQMNPEQINDFISTYSFAVMIDGDFEATHLPLVYKPDEGEFGAIPKPPQDAGFSVSQGLNIKALLCKNGHPF